jgi:ribosome-binding protein aMBF1 (putative translation factor)
MADAPILDPDAIMARYGVSRDDLLTKLGIGWATVRSWRRGDRKPSLAVCQLAEKRLGIPKHELRPDVWPPPTKAAKAARRREAIAA